MQHKNEKEADKPGNSTFPVKQDKKIAGSEQDNENKDLVEPENALPEVNIEDLPKALQEAAARAGWTKLMPVQAKTIPYVFAKRDLMTQSRTGSGKTGAFILPILERIDPKEDVCQALVLVPTRELARQVSNEAEMLLGRVAGIRTAAVFGGVKYNPQIQMLRRGAHVVVGTPGRILDHLLRGTLSLKNLKILVFDEADRMLSIGFYPDMKQVREYLPSTPVNGYMFSATFPPHVMRLAGEFLHRPEFLSLSSDQIHVADTEHVYYVVPGMQKDRCLVRIIEIENPVSAIIFCNTKATVHYVSVVLQRFGYDADELSADLSQSARERVLSRVRKGSLRFLVATDVAARGIDIPDLSHVVLYEPPEDPELYIHRAGRTGRMGASGVAISLVAGIEEIKIQEISGQFGIDLQERPLPSDEDVENIVSQRITTLLEARLRSLDKLQAERMRRFVPLGRSLTESEDESALIAMLLDDYYQKTLHVQPPKPPIYQKSRSRGSRNYGADKGGRKPGDWKKRHPKKHRPTPRADS